MKVQHFANIRKSCTYLLQVNRKNLLQMGEVKNGFTDLQL